MFINIIISTILFVNLFNNDVASSSSIDNIARIVGGTNANIEDFGFMVSLQFINGVEVALQCGGTILTRKKVLTAGHCAPEDGNIANLYVRAGTADYTSGGVLKNILEITQHSEFNRTTGVNDIAIVTIVGKFSYGPSIYPIALARSGALLEEDDTVTVAGWGTTATTSPIFQQFLQQAEIPVWSNERCRTIFTNLNENQVCYGGAGKGPCFRDSGGPAVKNMVQYGIVSRGINCETIPIVFSSTAAFRYWIKRNIR